MPKLTKLEEIRLRESKGYEKEDLMLSDFMVHLNNTFKDTNPDFVKTIFHIENEGNTGGDWGKIQGAISKGKGKKKGVLDVLNVYININWMEFKLIGKGFSDEQLDFIRLVISWGQPVFIIRTFDFFWYVVNEIFLKGVKLKGRIYTNIEQIKGELRAN